MTDALTIIEQTEPQVLPEARAFVLTTLDDVILERRDLRGQRDWRVEVWPNGRGDL